MPAAALNCFKAYDIRGRVPEELDTDIARRIAGAFAASERPDSVVVGHDIRLSSPDLADALIDGFLAAGVDVIDIGMCGTEEVYFATWQLGAGGGVMITASHNPAGYNGMKLVRREARPVSGDTGLGEIRRLAEAAAARPFQPALNRGKLRRVSHRDAYVAHLLGYIDPARLKPLSIVVNAGNGCAGPVVDRLAPHLPFRLIRVHHEPDGHFPHGVPNPLLPENRVATRDAVRASGADLGVAWDGDFDRCFFFDEQGEFVEGYYVVGLLAEAMLVRAPAARIVHDPRLVWNTREIVEGLGGTPVMSKTGHAFIKERMRAEDAVYGGEMSAHHYFRDFAYCDSGMIPWLLVASLVTASGRPLSQLLGERMRRYPCSGEINRRVEDPGAALDRVAARYAAKALVSDRTDGLGLEFENWRFNLRLSNTEPLIRLNVETRADPALLERTTREILALLDGKGEGA
jgi:phosphomannomutase